MDKTSVGVVGCGTMGMVHVSNFLKAKGVKEVVAFDASETRLRRTKRTYGICTFSDYQQFLERTDAICIATPNALHYQHSIVAINAGKHVLVEKPLAMTSKEAWQLVEAARRRRLILAVGTQKRFNPQYMNMREHLRNGYLGKPVLIRARMLGEGPRRHHKAATDWYYSREKGGGALFDLGAHMIDLVRWIYPQPILNVLGAGWGKTLDVPVEEYVFCLLQAEDNVIVSIEVGWFTKFHEESMEIVGTMGEELVRDTKTMKDWALSKFGSAYFRNSDQYWQDQAFINSCLKGTYAGCLATGEDGACCISVIEKIYAFLMNKKGDGASYHTSA
jgi:predicted dehydrogenase